jgi:hypothetical protein
MGVSSVTEDADLGVRPARRTNPNHWSYTNENQRVNRICFR